MNNLIKDVLEGRVKEVEIDMWKLYLQVVQGLVSAALGVLFSVALVVLLVSNTLANLVAKAFENVKAWDVQRGKAGLVEAQDEGRNPGDVPGRSGLATSYSENTPTGL